MLAYLRLNFSQIPYCPPGRADNNIIHFYKSIEQFFRFNQESPICPTEPLKRPEVEKPGSLIFKEIDEKLQQNCVLQVVQSKPW